MASTRPVAIPEKHLKAINELKADSATDKLTSMFDDYKPMPPMALRVSMAPAMVCTVPSAVCTSSPTVCTTSLAVCTGPPAKPVKKKEKQTTHTRSLIRNLTQDKVTVYDKKDWSGRVIGCWGPIEAGKCDAFHHWGAACCGHDPDGSKGAVIYAGKAGHNKYVAFLLAWYSAPYADAKNKVYVECGNLDGYRCINWEDIQKKLDDATEPKGHQHDCKTGAALSAEIDRTGINPRLFCILDVLN